LVLWDQLIINHFLDIPLGVHHFQVKSGFGSSLRKTIFWPPGSLALYVIIDDSFFVSDNYLLQKRILFELHASRMHLSAAADSCRSVRAAPTHPFCLHNRRL